MKQKQKRYSKSQKKALFKTSQEETTLIKPQTLLSQKFIRENYSTLPLNPENKMHLVKGEVINRLNTQLHRKLQLDLSARSAIQKFQTTKIHRLNKIQNEIGQINRQNNIKLKLLAKMQEQFLKKIEEQIKKDDEIQVRLIRQYQKIVKEEEKIQLTKSVIKLREKEDWIVMEKQQKKLQRLEHVFQKRQILMGRNKSLDVLNKKGKEKEELAKVVKQNKSVKKERNKKNADEMKEMGRQFLEHAKKVQAEAIKSNVKLLDLKKKSIDYLPEIKEIMRHHIQNLSKPLEHNESFLKVKKNKRKIQKEKPLLLVQKSDTNMKPQSNLKQSINIIK